LGKRLGIFAAHVTDPQENDAPEQGADAPDKGADTAGARLAARKAAKAARKAAKRGRGADQVEAEALKRATVAADWAQTHRRTILIGIGVLAVGLVGFWGYMHHVQTTGQAASSALWGAVETADAEIRVGDAPPADADDEEKTFATVTARAEAALEAYRKVNRDHGGTLSASWATLGEASALYELGKWAEARDKFERAYRQVGADDIAITWAALEGIVFTYEAEEKWDDALGKLEELGQASGGRFKDFADYHRARIQMAKGDTTAAKETLQTLLERLRSPENAKEVGQLSGLMSSAEVRLGEIDPSTMTRRAPGGLPPGFGPPGFGVPPGMGGPPGGGFGGTSEDVQRQIQELLQKMGQGGGPGAPGAPGAPAAPSGGGAPEGP
jgi:tetratricopeptide (TPR) repeat protein